MLNGISNAASTLGRQLVGIASRVSSAGGTGFSVAPQAVRLTPVRVHSPFSPGSSNVNARTIFNVSSQVTSFTPSRPAPPPPTSGQASGAPRPLPPIAQALKEHLAAYEKSKGPEALGFKPVRPAPPPPTSGQAS
ncbi:TPA: type III secretion system LEE effector EspF, partial [Escherichia coli]|nr:type III secretion system LEE effector EspF [Escherichia coli]